jgi:hypothetical protein
MSPRKSTFLVLLLALAVTLVYWPGLFGPLIFDDEPNLAPVGQWIQGQADWRSVVFGNNSGPLGRPVSMASFVANAAVSGPSILGFKVGNLLIHLLAGLALFALLRRLFSRDPALAGLGVLLPLVVTAVWLLHPMLVGTVLYVVQRMALLAVLFMVLAVLAYVQGRLDLESGRTLRGHALILGAMPALTALAALSKENGLLAPLICLVVEWACFRPRGATPRPWVARLLLFGGVGACISAILFVIIAQPAVVTAGYANRSFTLMERLLTQGPVMVDYLVGTLLPAGPRFSLFRDDYPISTSLLNPPWTLVAWLLLAGLAMSAVALRKRQPLYAAGIGIFFAGHAMESSVFPLLIYFEHRNYLPAAGLLMAVASLLVHLGRGLAHQLHHPRLVFGGATVALLLVLAAASHARAWVWQSKETLVTQSLENFPDSRFLRMEAASMAMNRSPPEVGVARGHYEFLLESSLPSTRQLARLGLLAIDCYADERTSPEAVEAAFTEQPEAVEADLLRAFEFLGEGLRSRTCEGLSAMDMGQALMEFLDRQPAGNAMHHHWRLRFLAAKLFHHAKANEQSRKQLEIAWQSPAAEAPVGAMLTAMLINSGDYGEAARVLDETEKRVAPFDDGGRKVLAGYRSALTAAQSGPEKEPDSP